MATPSSPPPASSDRALPSITVDGHALFEFSTKLNRALKRLEARFGARELNTIPASRKMWQQPPRKPR